MKKITVSILIMYILINHMPISGLCAEGPQAQQNQVAEISVSGAYVNAFNEKGDPIWVKRLENKISYYDVKDLEMDGNKEIILATNTEGDKTGHLYVLDSNGIELWSYDFGSISNIYQGESNRFLVEGLIVEDIDGFGSKDILINLRNAPWFATTLILFDEKGAIKGQYWHPGNIYCIELLDINNDGKTEIIGGGVNNDIMINGSRYFPVIFVLDPHRIYGQATPWLGNKNVNRAQEKKYLILPQSELMPENSAVTQIWEEDELLVALLNDYSFYYFYPNMSVKEMHLGKTFLNSEKSIEYGYIRDIVLLFAGAILGAFLDRIISSFDSFIHR